MKRLLLIPLLIIVGLLVGAYVKLLGKQISYQQSLVTTDHTVFVLKNLDKTNVKIVVGEGGEIVVNLTGDEEDLAKLTLESGDLFSQFGFSEEWSSISGTITVPAGTLIDLRLEDETEIALSDASGQSQVTDSGSLLIDTASLNSITSTGSGGLEIRDWGQATLVDGETWTQLQTQAPASEQPTSETGVPADSQEEANPPAPAGCGVGSQAIRDHCCQVQNQEDTPACTGTASWIFNNSLHQCMPLCSGDWSQENETPSNSNPPSSGNETSSGSEGGTQNQGGQNNQTTPPPPEEEPKVYEDPTSQFCSGVGSADEKNLCCNETLKNQLSTGPRPGFPDCIGEWLFDYEDGCRFECAEHTRMLEILQELKGAAQQ